jgi:hypothetical protein
VYSTRLGAVHCPAGTGWVQGRSQALRKLLQDDDEDDIKEFVSKDDEDEDDITVCSWRRMMRIILMRIVTG